MARFNVLPPAMRNAGEYFTNSIEIPDAKSVVLYPNTIDLVNEPSTTEVYWEIQLSMDNGQNWQHMVSGTFVGMDGVPPHKPTSIKVSIDDVVGYLARGRIVTNERLRFGIDGEIL